MHRGNLSHPIHINCGFQAVSESTASKSYLYFKHVNIWVAYHSAVSSFAVAVVAAALDIVLADHDAVAAADVYANAAP